MDGLEFSGERRMNQSTWGEPMKLAQYLRGEKERYESVGLRLDEL